MTTSAASEVPRPQRRSPWRMALAMLVLIAVFAVLREHWTHVAGYWPYLILLACPLMHVFGHKHGDHKHD